MKEISIATALGICSIFLAFFTSGIAAGDETGKSPDTGSADKPTPVLFPMDCAPYHRKSMKVLLKTFNRCSRELKANTTSDQEYEENIGCAMKCTMRYLGYTEESHLVTDDSIRFAVGKILPKILIEPVSIILTEKCHEKYGNKLIPDEAQCKAYSEYAFCIQTAIADMVDSDFCIKEEKNKDKQS